MNDDCPQARLLEALALGADVPPAARKHAENCAACRDSIRELRANQSYVQKARVVLRGALDERIAPVAQQGAAALPADVPGFELIEEISRGGQGIVYRAVQCATKRPAAIKMLLWGELSTVRQQSRFEREIEIAARLRHPNLITIFESGTSTDGRRYVAMEYVEGRSIDRYVQAEFANLSPRERANRVVELIARVASAVGHAHASGVIHRDLKPTNILLDAAGTPRVLDFGLARELDGLSMASLSQEFVGTPAYAAPEQFGHDPGAIDARTDVYSLGVILYAALTGTHPYPSSGSLATLIEHVRTTEPTPPSKLVSRLPVDIDVIVLKALSKDPARRYANAAALAVDLEDYLAGRPISARRDSTLYVLRKLARKHRVPAAAAVLALLVVLLALVGLTILNSKLDQQRQRAESALADSDLQRARLLAKTGNSVQAEQLLWRGAMATGLTADDQAGLEDSAAQRRVSWALMELYCILPRQMLVKTIRNPTATGFSREANEIWVVSQTGATERWSLDGTRIAATPELLPGPAPRLVVSSNGRHAALADSGRLLLLDLERQTIIPCEPQLSAEIKWASLHESGCALAIGDVCGNARVIDWEAGRTTFEIEGSYIGGRWDGDWLLLSYVKDGGRRIDAYRPFENALISELLLWDARPEASNAGVAALSPDERSAAAYCNVGLGLFSLDGPQPLQRRISPAPFSTVPQFAADGRSVMTTAYDGTICTWSVPELTVQLTYRGVRRIQGAAYCGPLAATVHTDGTLAIWRTEDSPWLKRVPTSGRTTHGLALSHDGKRGAAGDEAGQLTLFQTSDSTVLRRCAAHRGIITAIDFAPLDDRLTTFGTDGAVREWSVEGEFIRERASELGKLWCGRYSPDGRWIAAAGVEGQVFLWETEASSPPRVFADHSTRAPDLAFSADSRLRVSVGPDGDAVVHDLANGGATRHLGAGVPSIRVATIAPDSRTVAIGSDDRALSFWDAYSGKLLRTLSGLPWGPFDLQYHPSGRVLFVVGRGTEILVVDPIACTELATLPAHERLIFKIRLDSTGRRLLTAGEDDWIGIWDTDHLRECVRGNADFHGGLVGAPAK